MRILGLVVVLSLAGLGTASMAADFDFESYVTGSFPAEAGWELIYNGSGNEDQYVDNSHSVSGEKSLRLEGSVCWSANAYYDLSLPDQVSFESYIYLSGIVTGGCTDFVAYISILDRYFHPWTKKFALVGIQNDGNVYGSSMDDSGAYHHHLIGSFIAQTWYKLRIEARFIDRSFDVYINDELKIEGIPIEASGVPTGIEFAAGHGNPNPVAWFDDVIIISPVSSFIDSGDYNGDGTSDMAIFRGASGMWSVRNLTRVYFGSATDDLIPGDYNGDGTTDVAIFRGDSGMWSVRNLSRFYLGGANDQPVPGDYSGDSTAEAGIFRPSSGLWSIRNLTRIYLGSAGDTVVPGYYDTDQAKDVAIFRGSAGMWSVRNLTRFYFGASTDDLVPGDYNGAGKWEAGIFRPSSGMWSIRNVSRFYLGNSTDWPLPADYNGNGVDDAGIFRDTAGLWSVRNLTRAYFGGSGDIPVTR